MESDCPEPQAAPAQPPGNDGGEGLEFTVESPNHPNPIRKKGDNSPGFIQIPLTASNGRPYAVSENTVERLEAAYPGVDVQQELRAIREWNLASSKRRKTQAGIEVHITKWMASEQNKARSGRYQPTATRATRTEEAVSGLTKFAQRDAP